MVDAEEPRDVAPDRPELRLAGRERIGAVLAIRGAGGLRAGDHLVRAVVGARVEHRLAYRDALSESGGVDRAHRVVDERSELRIERLQRRHRRAGDDVLDVAGQRVAMPCATPFLLR